MNYYGFRYAQPARVLARPRTKKFGQQEYIYPAKPQEIHGIIEELLRRGLIEKERYERVKKEVAELENNPRFAAYRS